MIYFIQCQKYIKIGKSKDPDIRIKNLQVGNPFLLTLLKVLDLNDEYEIKLHRIFHTRKIRGEWF